jgi:flagellar biosynthesis protein FlhA
LESLADNAGRTKDVDQLGELVRIALARSICKQYVDEGTRALHCITLDPQVEQNLIEKIQPGINQLVLEPATIRKFMQELTKQTERITAQGYPPVVLSMHGLRLPLRRLTERNLPQLVILSYNEIVPQTDVRAIGSVSFT